MGDENTAEIPAECVVDAYWRIQTAMAPVAEDPVLCARLWDRILERLSAHEEYGRKIRLELMKAVFRTAKENPALPGLYDDVGQAAHVLIKMTFEDVDYDALLFGLLEQPGVVQIVEEEGARMLLEVDAEQSEGGNDGSQED